MRHKKLCGGIVVSEYAPFKFALNVRKVWEEIAGVSPTHPPTLTFNSLYIMPERF